MRLIWLRRCLSNMRRAVEAAKAVGSGFKREWRDSCTGNHSDWRHMFWDKAAALAFLGTHYPWFTSTFLSYPKVVLQGGWPRHSTPGHAGFWSPCMRQRMHGIFASCLSYVNLALPWRPLGSPRRCMGNRS
jgi:hypothetical protein